MSNSLPLLSLLIVALALLILLGTAVLRVRSRSVQPVARTTDDFFLMGQAAGPVLLAVSYCATFLSAFTFVGLPGFFHGHGAGTWLFIPFANIGAVLLFLVVGRHFRRLRKEFGTYSPIDILARVYKSDRLGLAVFCVSTVFIVPHLAVQISGFARLASSFGFEYQLAAFLLLGIFLVYTLVAGMWGDVWTDFWQAIVMIFGLWVLASTVMTHNWHWSLPALFDAVAESRGERHLTLPGSTGFFSYPALISYVTMFVSVGVVQAPYAMRMLIARGDRDLRLASAVIPWLLLGFFVPTFLIGMAGSALFPDLASGDMLIGTLLSRYFGSGGLAASLFLGLVLTGLTFAVLSTVDSQLLALGATFSKDVYRKFVDEEGGPAREIRVSRAAMIAIAILAFVVSLNPPRLIVQLSILSVAGTLQLLPIYIAGVMRPHPPATASAFASLLTGLATFVVANWAIAPSVFRGVHAGVVGLLVGTLVLVASELIVRYTDQSSTPRES